MWRGDRQKAILSALLIGATMSLSVVCSAQIHASASIAVSATLPSSVTLSETQIPVTIVVSNGAQIASDTTISAKWNLDTRAAGGFRIVATVSGSTIPASSLEARIAGAPFRGFGPANSMVLMNKVVSAANRQGEQPGTVQIRFSDTALTDLPDGIYQGWIKLEAQIL